MTNEERAEAERYWTEVLGMAEPKYCCNGVWEYFCKGRESLRGEVSYLQKNYADKVSDCRYVQKLLEAERGRSARLIEALQRCASPYSSIEKENVAKQAIAECKGSSRDRG